MAAVYRPTGGGFKVEWAHGVVGHTGGDTIEYIPSRADMLSCRVPAGATKPGRFKRAFRISKIPRTILSRQGERRGGLSSNSRDAPVARVASHVRMFARGSGIWG